MQMDVAGYFARDVILLDLGLGFWIIQEKSTVEELSCIAWQN